jgi:predicted RND superfamily exporter protein
MGEVVGGSATLNLLVEAQDVTDPAVMNWMVQFGQRIQTEQGAAVGSVNTLADLVFQATQGQMPQDAQMTKMVLANFLR